MRKLRSILAAVMAVMLILTAVPFTASAANLAGFSDFPTGWSYAAMTDAVNNGLLTGYGDGTIRPQERLTRAQMAAIINRAFGAEIKADIAGKYSDVNPGDWFYDDIAKAVNMKTFAGDDSGNMRPNEPITREDAMVVISRALVVSSMGTELLYNYTDRDTVDGYAEAAVCAFLDRHYVQGYGDGTIRGRNYITREEFAQIMDNIFAAYVRVGGEISVGNSEGEVIITGDNIGAGNTVRISSSYINGDLIIGDGLSTADIIIENVDVKGRILLRGGEGTVTFKNVKLGTLIVTNDVNGTVNFLHYSDEALFKNAVYNTPATFLDRTVDGGSASGTGRLNHDTTRVGNKDAGTGPKEDKKPPIIVVPGGGGTVTNYYTVNFRYEDGTLITGATYNVRSGSTLDASKIPAIPAKTGYDAKYWYYYATDSDKIHNRKTVFTSTVKVNNDIEVYPYYEKKTFTVTFDPDNGESATTVNVKYNETAALPTAPTKTGFVFAGWFYTEGGVEKEFTAATPVTDNITAKAKWTTALYTVIFKNGADEHHKIENIPYDTTVTLPTAPIAPAGQTFVGWFYTEGGTEKEFTAATKVTSDLTVTAKWDGIKYTVTFDPDNGEAATVISDIAYNATVTLPTAPTKTGFMFAGWFYTEGGAEKEFTAATPVTDNITVKAKWTTALYTVIFKNGADEYHKIENIPYDTTVMLPTAPIKTGFTFGGWFDEHGIEFTDTTKVTANITVYAKWIGETFTVTFWEIDEERNKVENVASGEKVSDADITTANDALDEAELAGYVANKSNISATYDKDVKHMVPGDWYFKEGTEWKKFDSTIAVYRDLDVYYMFTFLKVHLNLSSYLGTAGNIAVDVPYAPDTEAVKSVLDGLYLANSSAVLAMQKVLGEAYGRSINAFGASYTPVGNDGKLGNFKYNYRLINLLGEGTIRRYTKESIEDMILNDKTLLAEGIKTVASHLGNTSSSEYVSTTAYLKTTDGKNLLRSFMNDNEDFWIDYLVETPEGRAILLPYLRTLLPGYTDAQIMAMIEADPGSAKIRIRTDKAAVIEYILSSDANLASMIEQACKVVSTDNALRDSFADKAADTIHAATDKDAAFVDRAVEAASAAYEDKIEEFITSLKNDDTFLVDADRKFIILALSKKLASTTYDEIKAKLPSAIFKILDDAVAKDIFDKTLDAYRTQVDAVKATVTDPAYDGTKQYVNTCCLITVDPVKQVLIPEYDRFFVGKIDPAIKDNKYYTLNPYIAEIEQLLKVESILDKKTDGYYMRSASDYYALIYKLAVLSTDAGTWFVDNVPESELDDAIEATVSRIGGYLDRLIDKVTFLQNGKVDEARNRVRDLVRKLVDKNNSDLWNTATETLFTDKLPVAYDKAKDLIYDKLGFDADNTVIVTVGSDNETLTVTDGAKTVTKKLSDLLKQYADGKKGISVSGTVITVKGKSLDAKKVVSKLTAKFGSTFTVKVEHNADNTEYKLTVNSDYVLIQKILK